MSSLSYLKNKETEEPACEINDLLENNEDLIILTGNYRDFFGKLFHANKLKNFESAINLFKKNFQNRIYFEIQRHDENEEKNYENFVLNSSKSLGVPLIATQEVYYLNKDVRAHDALRCIGEKNFIEDKNEFKLNNQHYLKNSNDLKIYMLIYPKL